MCLQTSVFPAVKCLNAAAIFSNIGTEKIIVTIDRGLWGGLVKKSN